MYSRPAFPLSPPTISGTVLVGNSPSVTPGSWSRATDTTYSLCRDGIPARDLPRMNFNELISYVYAGPDIGPVLTLREHALAGGMHIDSVGSVVYDHVTDLPLSAIWFSQYGTSHSGGFLDIWASSRGGLSCILTAAGGVRPAYSASGGVGGRPLITADGVDDVMKGSLTRGASMATFEAGMVGRRMSFAAAGDTWLLYEAVVSGAYIWGIRDLDATRWRASSTGANVDATSDPSTNAHYSSDVTNNDYTVRRNGVIEATTVAAFAAPADAQVYAFGARSAAGAYAHVAVQAHYIGPKLTTNQRANLRGLLAYETGIAS